MITVHADTVESQVETYTSKKKLVSFEIKTVEVSIGNDRRRVRCWPSEKCITVYGLAVRFRTGNKVWPGNATYWAESGSVSNLMPNIDKFTGQFCQLVGFFEDHETSQHRSLHNAVA
jgi:hypothetical protein